MYCVIPPVTWEEDERIQHIMKMNGGKCSKQMFMLKEECLPTLQLWRNAILLLRGGPIPFYSSHKVFIGIKWIEISLISTHKRAYGTIIKASAYFWQLYI